MKARSATWPPFARRLLLGSLLLAAVPVAALVGAVQAGDLFLLDYVHVITGGTWTGMDIFMGAVMTRVMRSMDVPARVEVAKRLTPATLFFLPALASAAITSGVYLAQYEGKLVLSSPWIVASGVVIAVLTVQGFGILLPNGVRIFLELAKEEPDTGKIVRLNLLNLKVSGSQAAFQVVIILIMAHLAIY